MDINKLKTPLPLILIALFHIVGAILYGCELLLTEKEFNPNFKYYWIDLFLAGSRYFCESLFWASQPKQAAKT